MPNYDLINKRLNNEMQELIEKILTTEYTERDRNRLATIMYPKLQFFVGKFFNYDPIETEEALHNTMYKIWRGLDTYRSEYRFTTWIYTIARNEALLHKHKLTKQFNVRLDSVLNHTQIEDPQNNSLERELYIKELYKYMLTELYALPECVERSILIDRLINSKKGTEIAQKYNMNLNTVKTKIRKGRQVLKDLVLKNNPHMCENLNEYL